MDRHAVLARIAVPAPHTRGGSVNALLLPGELPAVVDPGPYLPEAKEALVTGLRQRGLDVTDVGQVVITQAHPDHAGLAPWLAHLAGAPIRAHPLALADLSDRAAAHARRLAHLRRAGTVAGLPPSTLAELLAYAEDAREPGMDARESTLRPLHHGQTLDAAGRSWQVVHTPGHTPDHHCFYHRGGQALLTGKLLSRHESTAPELSPHRPGDTATPALQQLIVDWRATSRLAAQIAWPSHGAPIRALRLLVARRLAELRIRLRATRKLVTEGAGTVWEIALGLGMPLGLESVATALGTAGAMAEWLAWRGFVARRLQGGVARYSWPATVGSPE